MKVIIICDNEVMISYLESTQELCAKCIRLIAVPPLTDLEARAFMVLSEGSLRSVLLFQ